MRQTMPCPPCPNSACQQPHVVRNGTLSGRQRFNCLACGAWFGETHGRDAPYVRRLLVVGHAPAELPPETVPPAAGRFEQQAWREQPLWWGGIVRDLHWHGPVDWQVVVSALEPTQEWWLMETPAGDILYEPFADPSVR